MITNFGFFEKGRSQNRPLTLHVPVHSLDRVSVYLQLHLYAVLTYLSSPTPDCRITQFGMSSLVYLSMYVLHTLFNSKRLLAMTCLPVILCLYH